MLNISVSFGSIFMSLGYIWSGNWGLQKTGLNWSKTGPYGPVFLRSFVLNFERPRLQSLLKTGLGPVFFWSWTGLETGPSSTSPQWGQSWDRWSACCVSDCETNKTNPKVTLSKLASTIGRQYACASTICISDPLCEECRWGDSSKYNTIQTLLYNQGMHNQLLSKLASKSNR